MSSNDYTTIGLSPTIHATTKDFSDFQGFMERVQKEYSKDYGIVKVIPPKSWRASARQYENSLHDHVVAGPIEQNMQGKGGIYECLYIQKKSMPMKEYIKKAQSFNHITDGKKMEEIESIYWKNISFSPPLYGADVRGSLFDKGA